MLRLRSACFHEVVLSLRELVNDYIPHLVLMHEFGPSGLCLT